MQTVHKIASPVAKVAVRTDDGSVNYRGEAERNVADRGHEPAQVDGVIAISGWRVLAPAA